VVQTDHRQYLATITDAGGGEATFGARYLFAALAQREVSAQLRLLVALTPELVVDAYVEPFASSGRFTGLGELERARGRDLRRYGDVARGGGEVVIRDGAASFTIDEPDFTVLSLRSTAVLRWELRPGSVLYAVWQQDRGRALGAAHLGGDTVGDLVTAPGGHVLAVKLAWWWSP